MGIEGKRVLVTGGASGIGRAAALHLASQGGVTAILDVDQEGGEATVAQIRASGGMARFWRVDVAVESDVAEAMDELVDWLQGLDAVVHCAGITKGQGVDIREFDASVWLQVLSVNLTGSFYVAKHAARHMIDTGGVMLLVASVGGVVTGSGSYAYGASKGGMLGLALTLDMHLSAHGIRVHLICPDGIDTPLYRASVAAGLAEGVNPERYEMELGTPSKMGEALGMLIAAEASYFPLTIVCRPRVSRSGAA